MIGVIFPGQGSQQPHSGQAFQGEEVWKVAELADQVHGATSALLVSEDNHDRLRQTADAQMVVLTHALMCLQLLHREGIEPDVLAGHSVGEFAALVGASMLTEHAALRLVALRGRAMTRACETHPGGMTALSADTAAVEDLLADVSLPLWVAAENGPRQIVVGGTRDALELLDSSAGKRHIRTRRLDVAGAFHTPLMRSAQPALEDALGGALKSADLIDGRRPVIANVDGSCRRSAREWRRLLVDQLVSPVRWAQCVTTMAELGVDHIVELGPSTPLRRSVRRLAPRARYHCARTPEQIRRLRSALSR